MARSTPARRRPRVEREPEVPFVDLEPEPPARADIEAVEVNELSIGRIVEPSYLARRQRVAIDLRGEASSLTLSVTGPASIDISG